MTDVRYVGWRVHGWRYPIVWFVRRKPRSDFRQWLWDVVDAIQWRIDHYRGRFDVPPDPEPPENRDRGEMSNG